MLTIKSQGYTFSIKVAEKTEAVSLRGFYFTNCKAEVEALKTTAAHFDFSQALQSSKTIDQNAKQSSFLPPTAQITQPPCSAFLPTATLLTMRLLAW